MNIPIDLRCQSCKKPFDGVFIIGAPDIHWDCKKCGQSNTAIMDLDFTIGRQVWIKSSYELTQTKDFSMAVILAATSIDCELSSLFCKWTGIAELPQRGYLLTDDECEELLLLQFRRIEDKFKGVTKLLVPEGFQHYASTTTKWRDEITKDLPELGITSLVKSIEKEVFWPRNRILHGGTPASAEQAKLAVRIARMCLGVFLDMDYERRKTIS